MNDHQSAHATGSTNEKPRTRVRAEAKITVDHSEAIPYDQSTNTELVEITLRQR